MKIWIVACLFLVNQSFALNQMLLDELRQSTFNQLKVMGTFPIYTAALARIDELEKDGMWNRDTCQNLRNYPERISDDAFALIRSELESNGIDPQLLNAHLISTIWHAGMSGWSEIFQLNCNNIL
jgi:hypothetical protein